MFVYIASIPCMPSSNFTATVKSLMGPLHFQHVRTIRTDGGTDALPPTTPMWFITLILPKALWCIHLQMLCSCCCHDRHQEGRSEQGGVFLAFSLTECFQISLLLTSKQNESSWKQGCFFFLPRLLPGSDSYRIPRFFWLTLQICFGTLMKGNVVMFSSSSMIGPVEKVS